MGKAKCLPSGLGYIVSVLSQNGHSVEIMDINAYRWNKIEVEERIKTDYDVIGIGGIVTTHKYVKWLVAILKKHHPGKKVIVGGSVGTSISGIMLEKTPVDISLFRRR